MLSYPDFSKFAQSFDDASTLTVYLAGGCHDPAERKAWWIQLNHSLGAIQLRLATAPFEEQRHFARCVELLGLTLATMQHLHTVPSWVIFLTADGLLRMEPLSIEVPTQAVWSVGPHVTPYVRAIAEDPAGVVVLVSTQDVAVYRYHSGSVLPQRVIRTQRRMRPSLRTGTVSKRERHHDGRGEVNREAAQRVRHAETTRMLRDAVQYVTRLAGNDGWILVGGIPDVGRRLVHALPHALLDRVLQLESLDVHASPAEILDGARHGISLVRDAASAHWVAKLLTMASHSGRVAFAPQATRRALREQRVHELYVSSRYLEGNLVDA